MNGIAVQAYMPVTIVTFRNDMLHFIATMATKLHEWYLVSIKTKLLY